MESALRRLTFLQWRSRYRESSRRDIVLWSNTPQSVQLERNGQPRAGRLDVGAICCGKSECAADRVEQRLFVEWLEQDRYRIGVRGQ